MLPSSLPRPGGFSCNGIEKGRGDSTTWRIAPVKMLISGSTGLIGSSLIPHLARQGHSIVRLVRTTTRGDAAEVHWNPSQGEMDVPGLEGMDAIVHLAGENIGNGRWTARKKSRILGSRVEGTRLLVESLIRLAHPPKVLVTASATGYYGSRGDKVLDEYSPPGSGFLPRLCREWEAATSPAAKRGIRVVNLRMAPVLTPKGGILPKMLTPFRLGLGARLGRGRQYMSWISMDDLVAVFDHVLRTESLRGVVNAVSPCPVTNREFTETLARILRRPAFLSVPSPALRLLLGEMADQLLLASQRVEPSRLKASGYRFRHPDLESALRHFLPLKTPQRSLS